MEKQEVFREVGGKMSKIGNVSIQGGSGQGKTWFTMNKISEIVKQNKSIQVTVLDLKRSNEWVSMYQKRKINKYAGLKDDMFAMLEEVRDYIAEVESYLNTQGYEGMEMYLTEDNEPQYVKNIIVFEELNNVFRLLETEEEKYRLGYLLTRILARGTKAGVSVYVVGYDEEALEYGLDINEYINEFYLFKPYDIETYITMYGEKYERLFRGLDTRDYIHYKKTVKVEKGTTKEIGDMNNV